VLGAAHFNLNFLLPTIYGTVFNSILCKFLKLSMTDVVALVINFLSDHCEHYPLQLLVAFRSICRYFENLHQLIQS
jgi:hypothetical protein